MSVRVSVRQKERESVCVCMCVDERETTSFFLKTFLLSLVPARKNCFSRRGVPLTFTSPLDIFFGFRVWLSAVYFYSISWGQ